MSEFNPVDEELSFRHSAGRCEAFDEVLALLEAEIFKFKDCGDLATAEAYEVLRAKVKAKKLK